MFHRRSKKTALSAAAKETKDRRYIEKLIGQSEKDIRTNKYRVPEVTEEILRKRKFELIIKLLIPPVLLFIILTQVILISIVPSGSMVPTLREGDFLVSNRLAYVAHDIERGDIVLFIKNGSFYVKRVIGLSGDVITLHEGNVYINGVLFNEPYLAESVKTYGFKDGNNMTRYVVPRNFLFVMGDNRDHSADSRYWTNTNGEAVPFVNVKNVKAKLLFSVSSRGFIPSTSYDFSDIPMSGTDLTGYEEGLESDFSYLVKPDVSTEPLESNTLEEETLTVNKTATEESGVSENNQTVSRE